MDASCVDVHPAFGVRRCFVCSFFFFIENTQEDIQYVLDQTSQQFQAHMQLIEDGAFVSFGEDPVFTYPLPDEKDTVLKIRLKRRSRI